LALSVKNVTDYKLSN